MYLRFAGAGVGLMAVATFSQAALEGVMPGFPLLVYDGQGSTTYDAGSGLLTIAARPVAIRFEPASIPRLVEPAGEPPQRFLSILVELDLDGNLVGGLPGPDLIIVGQVDEDGDGDFDHDGTLLTGEILSFGFQDTTTFTDQYDFRFAATGGSLEPLYAGRDIGVTVLSESSTFTGEFTMDFSGEAKGVVGPIDAQSGACCLAGGSCLELTEAGCLAEGGIFQGPFTECDVSNSNVVWGVNDVGSSDSQLFVLNLDTGGLQLVGPVHDDADLEGMAFAGTRLVGGIGTADGPDALADVDFTPGTITPIVALDLGDDSEVNAMAHDDNGVLWAFLQDRGFATIDLAGNVMLDIESDLEIEGLAASADGRTLWAMSADGEIYEVDVASGDIDFLDDIGGLFDDDDIENLALVSPGVLAFFTSDGHDLEYSTYDLATGNVQTKVFEDLKLDDVETFVFAASSVCPDVPAVGACCFDDGSCVVTTEDDCAAQGGDYQGNDAECGDAVHVLVIEKCDSPFEDISRTGIEAPIASNSDDNGDIVEIGFTFSFFKEDHDSIGISSNGYLTFGSDLGNPDNAPIPSPTDPNDLIAPWWDDLRPDLGGTVHYQTLDDPVRFIAQWTNVPHFDGAGPSTFQAVLYADTNCIEFRYGDLNRVSPTVGVENPDGSDGLAIDPAPIEPGDCIRLCPTQQGGCKPAPPGACCLAGGSCLELTEAGCLAEGGIFQGPFTECDVSNSNVVWGVNDVGSSDSQLFVLNLDTGGLQLVGPVHDDADLEGMAFAGTRLVGGIGTADGPDALADVDFTPGTITPIVALDLGDDSEVNAMAHDDNGVLWAFLQDRGFATIDLAGNVMLDIESDLEIEGLAASADGRTLWAMSADGEIYEVDVASGDIDFLDDIGGLFDDDDIENLALVSPGVLAFFTSDGHDLEYSTYDLATGNVQTKVFEDLKLDDVETFVFAASSVCPQPLRRRTQRTVPGSRGRGPIRLPRPATRGP